MNHRHPRQMILICLTALLALGASSFAQAGDRGYRDGYGRHHGYSQQRFYRHDARRHHYRPARGHRHHHNGRHDLRTGLKVVAGAVLLGTIVHAVTNDRRDRVVYQTRTVAPRNDAYYRFDPDGACVAVTYNSQGQEVWTYVDQSYCY